ncbi:BglG family transcription antiterminator [Gottfriedia sp. NPDC058432]|uniref:BglG family transcription antiterminator n=1 Tax=Gottfriedia sp. NPDC058432 TaxID=3346497 RepID=UPI0036534C56
MINMHPRSIFILQEFLKTKSVINGNYLSKFANVSSRTIRADIKMLNVFIREHGAVIQSYRGNGYQLEILDDHSFYSFIQTYHQKNIGNHSDVPIDHKGRVLYILRKLLGSPDYIKLEDLAEEIYVSKSTVNNLIKDVKKLLGKYKLILEKRPNYGVCVKGDEFNIRSCMSEYYFNRDIHTPLMQNVQFMLNLFKSFEIEMVKDIMLRSLKEKGMELSDQEFENLLVHILISIERIRSGSVIKEINIDTKYIEHSKEYQISCKILSELEKAFSIHFPYVESIYITIHLMGTKVASYLAFEPSKEETVDHMIQEILQSIFEEMNIDLQHDEELKLNMAEHLYVALNRIKYGLNVRNPIIQDIKTQYPLAFEAGLIAAKVISSKIKKEIEEGETGYLAIHLGASIERQKKNREQKRCLIVCATGKGSAQLLKYKLIEHFGGSLDIVDVASYYNLKDFVLEDQIDFIISTVTIDNDISVPVIKVNTILGKDDVSNIRKKLFQQHSGDISNHVKSELVFLQQQMNSREEVIRFLSRKIVDLQLGDDAFCASVLEREVCSSTAFGNLVAIPHPIKNMSQETFIAFCTLAKPIDWGGTPVQLVCLFSVKQNNKSDLQYLYDFLYNILDNKSTVDKIIGCTSQKEFNKLIDAK